MILLARVFEAIWKVFSQHRLCVGCLVIQSLQSLTIVGLRVCVLVCHIS